MAPVGVRQLAPELWICGYRFSVQMNLATPTFTSANEVWPDLAREEMVAHGHLPKERFWLCEWPASHCAHP